MKSEEVNWLSKCDRIFLIGKKADERNIKDRKLLNNNKTFMK
jgi:hypothetical protein